jgi:hypothetical protein
MAQKIARKDLFQLNASTHKPLSSLFLARRRTMQLIEGSKWLWLNYFNLLTNLNPVRAVIRELVETEEEFGKDLQAVVDRYIKAIDNKEMKVPRIVRDNKDLIFMNFKQIADFHNTWVDCLNNK